MCGIAGKLNFDRDNSVNPKLIRQMMDLIRHRGPDGSGEYISGSIGLGHRRLSIIDIDAGAQPMSNENGTVWVVYNGEIYNFQALRAELKYKGHQFKSTSDTEVIVHLYEELGDQCVSRLRGMFAFALWDEVQQRLLLARDRVGIKPLYYASNGKTITFASEIKSILIDPDITRKVNTRAIDRFITYNYLPGNETPFENIFKLDPGHYLTVQNGSIDTRQYWDLTFKEQTRFQNFDSAVIALQELLSNTVKDHMISDVPVGVLLSGGVDSTGILSYAAQHSTIPIHTFTIGFNDRNFADERPYAKIASQKFETIHHEISMTANEFRDFLPQYVWHMEEWVCEPPALALYFVSHLARESSIKVLLSGEGGDEAFGGYSTYRNFLIFEKMKSFLGSAKGILQPGFQLFGNMGWKQFKNYGNLVDLPLAKYYLSRTATPNSCFNRLKTELYTTAFLDSLENQTQLSAQPTSQLFERMKEQSLLNSMLYIDTKTWLPDDLLVKADKMTMATSVELRVPLLDFQVLEFAASLPESYKVSGWKLKRILKAALEKSVPQEILNRKKTGFPVPYDSWIRNEMKEYVFDTILAKNTGLDNYFSKKTVTDLLQKNQLKGGYSKEIFNLLIFELWYKQFIYAG